MKDTSGLGLNLALFIKHNYTKVLQSYEHLHPWALPKACLGAYKTKLWVKYIKNHKHQFPLIKDVKDGK